MNDQPPERRGGRRRLREPGPATPPPSRPAPRRADARDPRAADPRRGAGQEPPRRGQAPSGEYDLPQPSRRARPDDAPPAGRRRRLEPPGTLPPVDDELDVQARRAAPARAARARHGLDEGSEIEPPPSRRRPPREPADEAELSRRRRAALDADEPAEPGRRRAVPDQLAEPGRRRAVPDPGMEPPGGRRTAAQPAEGIDPPRRRRAASEPVEGAEPAPRRGVPGVAPPPARRPVQPGDPSVGMPETGPEPPNRRRPPVRQEPPTDVLPALAPPPPHEEPEDGDFLLDDEYDEYAEYDEYGDYDDAEYEDEYDDYAEEPEKPRKKKRGKRALGWVAAIAVIALLAGGAYYGFTKIFGYDDYQGSGDGDVLFQVDSGDSTSAIGAKLATAGVVASGKAFVKAGADNPKVARIQHGFYVMKSHMSGASAVDRITADDARVGQLEIRPYTQLDDITQPDGKVTPGVFSLVSKASCAQLNGKSTCVSADDLRKAAADADLKTLGVPDWAVDPANATDRKDHRLEGLIAPGLYDIRPGSTPPEILGEVVRSSTEALQNSGLSPQSTGPGMTPYQTLIIASIIEREAVKADFGKLSRVIYNRLAANMRLQMDSTVNYVLDRPTLATNDDDRNRAGAYNTYKNTGLTPTPISVPSPDAIKAAVQPTPGDWVYVVKCEKNGLSCFAVTFEDHRKNVDLARERGVF